MRPSEIKSILSREFQSLARGWHTPTMLWGPPGVGKSDIVRQVAAGFGVPVLDIRLSQLDPTDLRGIPFRVDDRVEWAIPTMLPDAERHGPEGILFLDELTAAPVSVSTAAYQLVLDRRLGDYRVPSGWMIVAAGNRHSDRGVAFSLPTPLANRFAHYDMEAHLGDWSQWAMEHGIEPKLVGFLLYRPERLFEFDPAQNPVAFPTPRSWVYADRALKKFAGESALRDEALAACVGASAAWELRAFLDHMEALPDIEAILRGESVAVPSALDLQYGVAVTLARRGVERADDPDGQACLEAILSYAGRLPQHEVGVMLVAELVRGLGRRVFALEGFSEWAEVVGDLLVDTGPAS